MRSMIRNVVIVSLLSLGFLSPLATSRAADDASSTPSTQPSDSGGKKSQVKFSGTISAVDTTAKTITIEDQVYTFTDETQITKDGNTATFADVAVGLRAHGSYKKNGDKLEVTKVRFGKKAAKKNKSGDSATTQPDGN